MSDESSDESISQPSTSKGNHLKKDSGPPIVKRDNTLPKADEIFPASGVKRSLHGIAYQWKILMLLAKRCQKNGYSFRLATEKDDAEKFDDAVLVYKDQLENITAIFLQAKHTQEDSEANRPIKKDDLLTEKDDKFSLQKYFSSYQKIKRSYKLEKESQKYFIIYTNIGFGFDSDYFGVNKLSSLYFKSVTKASHPSLFLLLNIEDKGSCYQLDTKSKSEMIRDLKKVFEKTSDCQNLTNDLVECILNEESIGLNGHIKTYQKFLVKYVFDLHKKKFNEDFINGKTVSRVSDDIKAFHYVLLERIKDCIEEKKPQDISTQHAKILNELSFEPKSKKIKLIGGKSTDLWSVFKDINLKFSEGFEKITILESNPQIADLTAVANEICRLINENKKSGKPITINRGNLRGNRIIIRESNNLAGHVLVKKIKGGEKDACFSEKFLIGNDQDLRGNISKLRDELIKAFKVKDKVNLRHEIDTCVFNITNFELIEEAEFESLLKSEMLIPTPRIIEKEIEEFLSHLIFMVNQPNERELSVVIGKEIGEEFNLIDDNLITSNFQDKIVNWLKEKAGTYITENQMQNFFDAMRSAISQFVMIGPTSEYTKKLDEYGLVFAKLNRKLTEFLNQFEDSPNIFNFITPRGETMLGSIEVSQILRGIAEYKQEDSYIFVRLSTFVRLDKRIVLAFKKKQTKLLIIECNLQKQMIENLVVGELLDSLSENKKLLLISSKDSGLINEFKKGNIVLKGKFEELEFKMDFGDLNKESQNKILENKINFQGNDVSLHKIISTDTSLIELLPLVDFLEKRQIKIGEDIPINYGYDPDYYIDRTFNKYTMINEDIFIDRGTGALSDALTTNEEEFEELKQKYPGANVHWLEKNECGEWILQKAGGSLDKLRKYMLSRPGEVRPTNTDENIHELMRQVINQKVVIIADTAGMGKSTVLTHLSKIIKNIEPSYWVVRINLNNHTDVLKKKEFSNFSYPVAAIEFVIDDLLKIGSDLEREIFKLLLTEKKVVLMLDGFDEISPSYKSTVTRLLQGLKESSVQQLWITTRPHLKEDLEEELRQVAYTLEPFSEDDQVEFLTKFWKKSLNSRKIDEVKISKFSWELVQKLASSINDKDKEFTGVPLQSHMLAEAFDEEFKEYYHSEGSKYNLPEKLDLLELYDKFLNRKYLVYVSEKNNPTIINVATTDLINILKGGINLRKIHQHLAIKMLVPQREKLLLENRKPRDLPNEKLSRIGIARADNKIDFVHRTFAEYYVADFLVEQLKKEKQTSKDIQIFILTDIFLSKDYIVVRSFIDNFLRKIDLLSSEILMGFGECINELGTSLCQPPQEIYLAPMDDPDCTSWKQDRELYEREKPQSVTIENVDGVEYILSTSSLKLQERQIVEKWEYKTLYNTGVGGSILHQTTQESNPHITDFILSTLENKKYRNALKRLLSHKDNDGQTVWYGVVVNSDKNMLIKLWNTAKNIELSQDELMELLVARDQNRRTSLHWATKGIDQGILDELWIYANHVGLNLKDGLFSNRDKYKRTPWCWAVQYGNMDTLNKLWKFAKENRCETDLFSHQDYHGNIWYWAAQNENIEILEKLWEWSSQSKSDIFSAWHAAATNGFVKVMEKLREWMPDEDFLHKQNEKERKTAWLLATEKNRMNVLDYLLNLTLGNHMDRKESLLDNISKSGIDIKSEKKELLLRQDDEFDQFINTLIREDKDKMNLKLESVKSVCGILRRSIRCDYIRKTKLLSSQDKYGTTAFHIAATEDNQEMLEYQWKTAGCRELRRKLLLSKDGYGHTPWYTTVWLGRIDSLEKIWEWTEDDIRDECLLSLDRRDGSTVWHAAAHSNKVEVFIKVRELTEEHIPKVNRYGLADLTDLPKKIKNVLLVKDKYKDMQSVWNAAVWNLNVDILDELWKWTKTLSIVDPEDVKNPFLAVPKDRDTIWHRALSLPDSRQKVIEKLLSLCEEANLTPEEHETIWTREDANGNTPLDLLNKNFRYVNERRPIIDLIEEYAKIHSGNLKGLLYRLCFFAIANSYADKVEMYLDIGADVKNDVALLEKAASRTDWHIVAMLIRYGADIDSLNEEETEKYATYLSSRQ